jgi:hypothetical protein
MLLSYNSDIINISINYTGRYTNAHDNKNFRKSQVRIKT